MVTAAPASGRTGTEPGEPSQRRTRSMMPPRAFAACSGVIRKSIGRDGTAEVTVARVMTSRSAARAAHSVQPASTARACAISSGDRSAGSVVHRTTSHRSCPA